MNAEQYLDALLALPVGWGAPKISDDGRWAAWTWAGAAPHADVYVAPTDGATPPVRLTSSDENSVLVAWTPDSRAVLVQQDHEGDERARLYRVALAQPGVMVPLTEESPCYFLRGGQLHPGGRWLVYSANLDEQGGEIESTWVYRHDLQTGERRPLARPQRPAYFEPELNETGTHILYTRQERGAGTDEVWLVDIEGHGDREALSAGEGRKASASWFPDGRRALALNETATHIRLGVWDRETGETRWLLDDPARNIERAFVPRGSDGTTAVVIELRDAKIRASLLDVASGVERPLPDVPGDLLPLRDLGGGWWVGEYTSSTHPDDLVRFRLDDVRPEAFVSLTRVWERTALRPHDLAPAQDFRWRSVDGLEIQGWLYRPQQLARGTVVLVHGGPTWYSQDRLDAELQYYIARGFNVLAPNYRGSTGFSLAFRELIKEDGWGGREQDDISTGVKALIAAGIAEAGKVGVTGTSYGGYSSWCQITRCPPELIAAAAPICGMTDLVVDYETTRPDLRSYSEEMLGGRPDHAPERYRERSPINFVRNIKGQLLIVQGLRDPNVSPENVRVVAGELQAAGVEYQLLAFEDEGHGIGLPKNQRVLFERLANFFDAAFG